MKKDCELGTRSDDVDDFAKAPPPSPPGVHLTTLGANAEMGNRS